MKKFSKDLLMIIIPLALCAVIYPFLPDRIPRTFHLNGTKSYMPKEFVFLIGFIPFIVYQKIKK